MPQPKNKPYVKWSDRKELERLATLPGNAIRTGRRGRPRLIPPIYPPPPELKSRKRRTSRAIGPCPECGKYGKRGAKFCGRSCSGRHARRTQIAWELDMARAMEGDGWEIISPTACCDRIGIKDGQVFFLEFKPQADLGLRTFQRRVMELVPSMYKIVAGTPDAALLPLHVAAMGKRQNSRKKKGSSRFVGVSWDKSIQRWKARIRVNGKRVTVGNFWSEEEASQAREDALRQIKEPPVDGSL